MGPYTASSCCCQVQSLSWVPVRPPLLLSPSPHSAMCHFQVSSHTLLVCSIFCHRVLTDYGPPIAAARPVICHGPPYRLVTLLLGPQCDMGPSPIAPTLPCATLRSPHTLLLFSILS
ncbi:unnamed protein product [Staurois parvus]|uniref:Uncharacterized protein n=1 Tax=Staurois parvus TaxID=386267 RepID=A0ABN9C6M0_9NEOB|nr:unnamed protein product [Staurois parvus]